MASDKVTEDSDVAILCKAYQRSVITIIKCVFCGSVYNAACVLYVINMKVVGYNELCCPLCSNDR